MLAAAHRQPVGPPAQGHHPLRFAIGIGVTLEGFDEIGARQAIAVDAQEAATEFLVDASERILCST